MICLLSPSKTVDFETPPLTDRSTVPAFLDDTAELVGLMKTFEPAQIGTLMSISDKLAELNHGRFQSFDAEETPPRQALLAFKGDVFRDFELADYSEDDFAWAQDHVRILSGLYGVLRPLDLIKPYRLEMGTRLDTMRGRNLYEFWGASIADELNEALGAQGDDILVNLASVEYSKAVDRAALRARVVDVTFLEERKGEWKIISFNTKRARGTMTNWIVRNRVDRPEDLKSFALDRYYFSAERSSADNLVFLRHPA